MAVKKGRFENILGYLLGKGADINIKDINGVNTCHYTINNKVVLLIGVFQTVEGALFINICCLKEEFVSLQNLLYYFSIQLQKGLSWMSTPLSK